MVSVCVLLATYYRHDVRRHLADLLTLTIRRHSPRPRDLDVIKDLRRRRRRRYAEEPRVGRGTPLPPLNNALVRLYNLRRRQYVASDVTAVTSSRRRDVIAGNPRGLPHRHRRRRRHVRSPVHFSNQISCTSCEYF